MFQGHGWNFQVGLEEKRVKTNALVFLLSVVIVALVARGAEFYRTSPPYILEDGDGVLQNLRMPGSQDPSVRYEAGLERDDFVGVYGDRLSLPGVWSLGVGDPVSKFDEVLGFPTNASCWPTVEAARGIYDIDDGVVCYVWIDFDTERVTKMQVGRANIMSINASPRNYWMVPEAEKVPGFWVKMQRGGWPKKPESKSSAQTDSPEIISSGGASPE